MPGIIDHKELVEKRWSSLFKPIQAPKPKKMVGELSSAHQIEKSEADLFDYFTSLPVDVVLMPICVFDLLANLLDLLINLIRLLNSYSLYGFNEPNLNKKEGYDEEENDALDDLNDKRQHYKENMANAALHAVFSLIALFNPLVDMISFILTRPIASLVHASRFVDEEQQQGAMAL